MSVEEYRQKSELLMLRAGIKEEERFTIARFQSGLNYDIRDKVELLPYLDLNDFVQQCVRVEEQIRRKTSTKRNYPTTSEYRKDPKRKGNPIRYEKPQEKEKEKVRGKEKERERERNTFHKESSKETRGRETRCFKCGERGHYSFECPHKRSTYLLDHQNESEDSSSDSDTSISEEEALPCEGELLLVRRLLGSQSQELEQSQRENLFRTRCKIFENTCSLIVDSGSSCNYCSSRVVNKLALLTISHPKPYKLQWITEDEEIVVNTQVTIPISIGNYEENVLCDVVPMDAGHVLLGRP
ncbi:hypothetical protein VIGAN_01208500 [Vigna angularis var. angularis]|uniref:CCHC-type domain-containing protein n=1 Tax=Vigna angularis var. angularis TaxID=157739 RepID=A0A0S3R1H7_PHAAN|nr:hypothetical protein VIGAN_01208500 [Vigna angularis var. angularis]